MEPVETRLARIEEHQVFVRGELGEIKRMLEPLIKESRDNTQEIALLKRDGKWRSTIIVSISGVLGALGGMAAEFWSRKG
jgi:hypothetical protein